MSTSSDAEVGLKLPPVSSKGARYVQMAFYSPGKRAKYLGKPVVIEGIVLRKGKLRVRLQGHAMDYCSSEVEVAPSQLSLTQGVC